VGFFTLLASALAGPAGRVVAIEPLPRNLELLRGHLALNHVDNVLVIASAVADAPGSTLFDIAASPSMGHIGAQRGIEVAVTTIDELVASGRAPAPHVIKMDI